jgi:hypothetical protein
MVGCRFRFLDGAAVATVKGLSCLSNHAFILARSASDSSAGCGGDFMTDVVPLGADLGVPFGFTAPVFFVRTILKVIQASISWSCGFAQLQSKMLV